MSGSAPDPWGEGGGDGEELGRIRSELRRLGYLDHQVERYLLQDALRPERPWETVAHLALKVGLLIGPPAALFGALGLASVNGLFDSSPFDLLPLFVHLLPLMAILPALAFLVPAAALTLMLRLTHARRIEALSLGFSMVAALGAMAAAARQIGLEGSDGSWLLAAVGLPCFAYLVFKVVHGGLLTLAIQVSHLPPEQPSAYGKWVISALLASTLVFVVPAVVDVERDAVDAEPSLPVAAGPPVVVIGVDGVPSQELDYLIAGGELPRLTDGGAEFSYARGPEPPIAFWTTASTGLPSTDHGLDALDTFQPWGVSRPLRRSGRLRTYWQWESRLGLASYRPILAANRHAWTFWELAGRGGAKSAVIGWWGTFPVEPVPGVVVAHGAPSLLRDGAQRVVHPPEAAATASSRLEATTLPVDLEAALRRSLPDAEAEALVRDVLIPDAFYLQIFDELWTDDARSAALYLSALDIVAAKGDPGALARADLVRWQLRAVDRLVDRLVGRGAVVVVVIDPGRSLAQGERAVPSTGRFFVHGAGISACDGDTARPEQIGAAVLRLLGLPQSRDIPEPPGCGWAQPSMRVDSFGRRRAAAADVEESAEYLENLKSLGYL